MMERAAFVYLPISLPNGSTEHRFNVDHKDREVLRFALRDAEKRLTGEDTEPQGAEPQGAEPDPSEPAI
jgi:hypothetical protein